MSDKNGFFSVDDGGRPLSFPFKQGSDIESLWGWGIRLGGMVFEDFVNEWSSTQFRPDASARDAMLRFSIKYPLIIKQIDDCLQFTEKAYTEFSDDAWNPAAESRDYLASAMESLLGRIQAAVNVIAEAADPGPTMVVEADSGASAHRISAEARALALLVDHPDWSDTQIAKAAGCARTSLYRFQRFVEARELQEKNRLNRAHGSKAADGTIEAWDCPDM